MSYQVLARKYRPRRFEELVGQEHVQKALKNALDGNRLHHAYLFTGTRGVGKTTIARILTRCLNCERGVSSNPCGECATCREIDEGRFVDLIEIDAASHTGVDHMRDLLDNVQYAPTRGLYKVYLIDEVHMLSGSSFNALLKTLEEPPQHVKFLLATTDPQKLPITVLSRCLQFNLKAMTTDRIVTHLRDILARENIPFDDASVRELSRAAQGSMRDALSLTDQAIAFGNGKLSGDDVRMMLGTVDRAYVMQVAQALASGDAKAVLATVDAIAENAPDWSDLLAGIISLLHRVCVAQVVPDAITDAEGDREVLLDLAQRISPADAQLYYQSALLGRRDLPLSPDARAGLEMTLLRMLVFRPVSGAAPPSTPTGAGESPAKKPEAPSPVNGNGAIRADTPVAQSQVAQSQNVLTKDAQTKDSQSPVAQAPAPVSAPVVLRAVPPLPVNASQGFDPLPTGPAYDAANGPDVYAIPGGNLVALAREWDALVARLEGLPVEISALARNAALEDRRDNTWEMVLAPGSEILMKEPALRALEKAVADAVAAPVKLVFVVRGILGETPRMAAGRRERERQAELEQLIRSDPNVRDMIEQLGARIVPGSIKTVK